MITALKLTAQGKCSLNGCEDKPSATDRWECTWCERHWAVCEAQNRPVKGRSSG